MASLEKHKPTRKEKAPSFEEALEELETMVETMESGQLPLEKLISHYERGAFLVNHCESVLSDARKRLELITLKPRVSSSGNPIQGDSPAFHKNNDDEIRLF